MIYHICSFFFLKHFRISIGLNFYWSPILEALLEIKKKNTKDTIKCSQYNVIMTVIDEFQQLNLFVFELLFYVIGDISIKLIVKFMVSLASLLKKVPIIFFLKLYFYKILGLLHKEMWSFFSREFFFLGCGALGRPLLKQKGR